MPKSDKEVRSEFIFLTVQSAMDDLQAKPSLAEVEEWNREMRAALIAGGRKTQLGGPDLFCRPGNVIGRCVTTIHNIIHNTQLGDYVERNKGN